MPPVSPCDIGIVFALGTEQGCTEDLLTQLEYFEAAGLKIRSGLLKDRSIVLVTGGVGRENAARATDLLIDGHRPEWIISAGFCGGLQPTLKLNDVVAADAFVGRPEWNDVLKRHVDAAAAAGAPPAKELGLMTTVDHIISKSTAKQELGAATGALACEMESSGTVDVCVRRGVQVLVLRAVSDPVGEDLPSDLEPLIRQKTAAGTFGAVVGALWRRPGSVKDMLKLQEHALTTADTLAKHLAAVMEKLPLKRTRSLDTPAAGSNPESDGSA